MKVAKLKFPLKALLVSTFKLVEMLNGMVRNKEKHVKSKDGNNGNNRRSTCKYISSLVHVMERLKYKRYGESARTEVSQ
jgi:hypothetical protein